MAGLKISFATICTHQCLLCNYTIRKRGNTRALLAGSVIVLNMFSVVKNLMDHCQAPSEVASQSIAHSHFSTKGYLLQSKRRIHRGEIN